MHEYWDYSDVQMTLLSFSTVMVLPGKEVWNLFCIDENLVFDLLHARTLFGILTYSSGFPTEGVFSPEIKNYDVIITPTATIG